MSLLKMKDNPVIENIPEMFAEKIQNITDRTLCPLFQIQRFFQSY